MSYKVVVHQKAVKELQKLPFAAKRQVEKAVDKLADNPRPPGYEKLEGFKSERVPNTQCYRIRIGDLRAIYTIEDDIITVTVVQVKKRGDIY